MRCQRCQGCLITDHFMDIHNVSGEMDFKGWRCLNCGDITDPIIARHHQSVVYAPAKSKRRWRGNTLMHSGS
jgi:RNase P subunit RPR2